MTQTEKTLIDMGFDKAAVAAALHKGGNFDAAMAILLGDGATDRSAGTSKSGATTAAAVVAAGAGKNVSGGSSNGKAASIAEAHHKFMSTYKVTKCKEKGNRSKAPKRSQIFFTFWINSSKAAESSAYAFSLNPLCPSPQ